MAALWTDDDARTCDRCPAPATCRIVCADLPARLANVCRKCAEAQQQDRDDLDDARTFLSDHVTVWSC